ncbi:hypothetical protein [Pontibacter mangrovi]|uniref:Uncharacterized protein n=1 Tax=Pontibacter mangrovi TaxID=2589816 RepID=A0A501W460_9BACT|nr:hypothetical protein [Pontibacter mangrovi]TPE44078.1 hypothetical protein FJM65_11715 [Pontibacter mangrovi]
MAKVLAIALLLLVGSASYNAPAEAASAGGPKLKGLFQKKGKGHFKKPKKTKYYHAAAKKHRKALWHKRTPMTP